MTIKKARTTFDLPDHKKPEMPSSRNLNNSSIKDIKLRHTNEQIDEDSNLLSNKQSRPTAMIVDDEILNLEIAKEILQYLGLDVLEEPCGQTAIDTAFKLLRIGHTIDIVFMDFNMPGMSGDEVTALLRQDDLFPLFNGCPFIGLTANTDQDTKDKFLKAGVTRVEHKPFDMDKFKEILRIYNLLRP